VLYNSLGVFSLRARYLITVFLVVLAIAGCRPDVNGDSTASEKASLAETTLHDGDPERALELYDSALSLEPSNPDASLWNIGRAECMLEMNRRDEALTIVSRYLTSSNPVTRARALLVKARIDAPSSPSAALNSLASMSIEDLDPFRAEIAVALCREQLTCISTEILPDYREQGWFELYVLLELEERYAQTGDDTRAALYGSEIDALYPNAHSIWGRPSYSRGEPDSETWIALLLPLTGEGSSYAQQVSRGAHLAFDRYREMHETAPDLVDFDTRGDSELLLELMQTLADNPSCVGILGPLTSSSTMAISSIAEREDMPVISPTATSGDVDRIGAPVFRLVVSEGNQAAAVAEYAMRNTDCRRFGIIYPFTAAASGEAEQFRAIIESMGGSIVASEGYQPGSTNFRSQINVLKAHSPQAVFLPVSAWDAVQIAPQLRFYNLEAPLFGTSGWDDDLLLQQGGEYVEGVVFTAAFGLNSLYPETARFVYTFNRAYGVEPTTISAQGYDAAGMMLDAWGSVPNPTRSRISRKLSSMDAWYGASGRCVLGSDSESRISWPMMTVTGGEIVGIE
jgi:branched-chain amino acid transport system substrate-binding protein